MRETDPGFDGFPKHPGTVQHAVTLKRSICKMKDPGFAWFIAKAAFLAAQMWCHTGPCDPRTVVE